MDIGTRVESPIYGIGTITAIYSDNMITIKFENNNLPIMCSSKSMETLHSGKKSKFKVIDHATES